jgi:hypothetical protein
MQITYEEIGSDCLFASAVGLGVHLIINTAAGGRVAD